MRNGVVAVLFLLASALLWPGFADAAEPPAIKGQAALLMDGTTGQVLWQYRGHDRNYPASTTKVLTALVAAEKGRLDQMITVSSNVTKVQGWDSSSCYINPGETQSLEALLLGLMLSSGNDCAVAIAEGLTGGNPDQFMAWMNEKAKALGATQSHFTNPSGLHDDDHYTTAYDLALILKAAVENPTLKRIMGTRSFVMPGHEKDGEHWNHNQLLFTYEGTVGGKTGFTEEAGSTLVSATLRGDSLLLGVVMGNEAAAHTYSDMISLFDYGFAAFKKASLVSAGDPVTSIPVAKGAQATVMAVTQEGFEVLVGEAGQLPLVERVVEIAPEVEAPVREGQPLGSLVLKQNGQVLATIGLKAAEAVEQKLTAWDRTEPYLKETVGWVRKAGDWLVGAAGWLKNGAFLLKWLLYAFGGLLIFRTVVLFIRRRLFRRRRIATRLRHDPGVLRTFRTRDR